ncbi:hypothetical protein ACM55G_08745 [Flavobacterium sp. LB3P122]
MSKNYKFNRLNIEKASWSPSGIYIEAIDPFGNRLTFYRGRVITILYE